MACGHHRLLLPAGVLVAAGNGGGAADFVGERRRRSPRCLWETRNGGGVPVAIGVLLLLAIATRLDAAAQALVILVYVVTRRNVDTKRRLIPVAIAALAVIGILFAQRMYFGDALPNTYYQKILGASAWERIRNGLLVFSQYALRDTLMLALFSAGGGGPLQGAAIAGDRTYWPRCFLSSAPTRCGWAVTTRNPRCRPPTDSSPRECRH